MKVDLSPAATDIVKSFIQSGSFASPEEVVEAALDSLTDWQSLRQELQVGLDQLDRGEQAEFTAEDIIAEGRQRLQHKKAV